MALPIEFGRNPAFSPSLPSETSVDLTARFRQLLRRRLTSLRCSRHPETSLGKVNILVPIPAISTISVLPSFQKAWISACCGTSSDLIASVYGFPGRPGYRHRSLAYFTACLTANQPCKNRTGYATCFASGRYPRTQGLSPVGTVNFLTYIHHSRHAQHLQKIGGSVVKRSFVLRIKFCSGRQFCASKSPTSFSCKTLGDIAY